jgi:hypothetical protein
MLAESYETTSGNDPQIPVSRTCIIIWYCDTVLPEPGTRAGRKAVPIMTTLTIAEPVAPVPVAAPVAAPHDKGLRAGALGLISNVVIAVSSTAPAYSMAATLGLIVAVVGVHSPGTLIIGVGSLVVGVVIMLVTSRFLPRYFAGGITAPMQGEGSTPS